MKLSCSDFTGGWSSAPAQTIAFPDRLVDASPSGAPLADLDFEDVADTVPNADALAHVLGLLFERTDEIPCLPFLLESPVDATGA